MPFSAQSLTTSIACTSRTRNPDPKSGLTAAAAERTRTDCMQRMLGGELIDEVRPKVMAIAIAAMAEELRDGNQFSKA